MFASTLPSSVTTSVAEASRSDLPAIAGGSPVCPKDRPLIFGAPSIGEAELTAVSDCLRSGWLGPGARVEQFETEFARYKGAQGAIAVNSGTAAIQLALWGLGIKPGDEVIAPVMTFVPSLHAIIHAGATPVLVDCRADTQGIDTSAIEQRITTRTKAIMVVHLYGRCCEMAPILALADRFGLRVIEDCAHAIEASYQQTPSGLVGDVGCFSFYATKNLTTGDGGMVISRDARLHRRMKRVAAQGITSGAWRRFVGGDNAYEVVALGYRCAMNDLAAALGIVQLARLEERWRQRERLWSVYQTALQGLPVRLPPSPEKGSRHAYHLYTVLVQEQEIGVQRKQVVSALQAENIGAGVHYIPAHQQPYYRRRYRLRPEDFGNATVAGAQTLSLPFSPEMTENDALLVAQALRRILLYFSHQTRSLMNSQAHSAVANPEGLSANV
jgi:dTDP-4-amino-4,6-dideoxygalactose transaminase